MNEETPIAEQEWVAVAQLLRAQGRRGEVLAEPLTDLDEMFAEGRQLWLGSGEAPPREPAPRTIESSWRPSGRNAGRVVLKLAGVDSIEAAEAVARSTGFVPAASMPALETDQYFVRDLLGATLWDGSTPVGEIEDVEFAVGSDGRTRLSEAAPLLAVRLAKMGGPNDSPRDEADDTVLVPFVRDWVSEVDLEARRVVMRLPQGLVERG